jgi:peptide-methionine (S)-S-oxide reductase
MRLITACAFVLTALACSRAPAGPMGGEDTSRYVIPADLEAKVKSGELADAVLAGGCFWCMEASMEHVDGVVAAVSGFSGGTKVDPTYEEVGGGGTGHMEVVRVFYDPKKLSYEKLLDAFWHNVDPTQADGQFCDLGEQYRSAIFVANDKEKAAAEATKAAIEKSGKLGAPIATRILPRGPFYAAEVYHQDFYKTHSEHYHRYREGCGRDRRLKALWGG